MQPNEINEQREKILTEEFNKLRHYVEGQSRDNSESYSLLTIKIAEYSRKIAIIEGEITQVAYDIDEVKEALKSLNKCIYWAYAAICVLAVFSVAILMTMWL